MKPVSTRDLIIAECERVRDMLLEKNSNYGDSIRDPVTTFGKYSAEDGIRIRLNDKLSRIQKGKPGNEDAELDIIGYLILLRIVRAAG